MPKKDSEAWSRGYLCAVAILARENGPFHSDVLNLLRENCPTLADAQAIRADEDDIAVLAPAWEAMAERRRL